MAIKKDELLKKAAAQKNNTQKVAPRERRPAICIKPADGKTYADVLRDLKAEMKPEKVGAEVKAS